MKDQQHAVVPHLIVRDATAALEFYSKALGATDIVRLPADDGKRLLHAEMSVNGAKIMLQDHFPEYAAQHGGDGVTPPNELHGTTVTIHVWVDNCDAAIKRAADAGAKVTMPAWDAFWGDRYGRVVDPFGHVWSFAHPLPAKQG
jgi:PhnB protein